MYGGSCAEYSQPGNDAWCDAYGAMGAPGATPNENCCVCKSLSNDEEEEIVLGGLRGRRRLQTLDSTYRYHFYPVAEQRSCLKNTNNNAPSYMYNAPQQYFFSSVEQCCSTSYATLTSDVDYCLKVSQAVVDVSASTGPRIGDQRVSFNETPESIITIVAVQNGNSLGAFVSETGEGGDILLFKQGTFTSAQMYEEAHLANQATTWIFRFLGWGAMGLGLYLLFRPLEVMADVLPCVGSIIGCGITFMAVLISAILSTLTISIAWLASRPQIGAIVLCVLLAVIGACGFGFKKYRNKRKEEEDDSSSSSSSSSSAKKDNGKEKTSDSTLEKNPLDLNGDGKVDEKDANLFWKMSKTKKGKVELAAKVSSFAASKASKKRDGGDANCSAPEGDVPTVDATPEQTNGYPERPPLQGATSPPQPYEEKTSDSTLEKNPLDLNGDGKVDEKDANLFWKMSKTKKGKVELAAKVSSFAASKASKKRDGGDANCSAPEGDVPTVDATPEQTNGYPERPPLQGATSPPQPYVPESNGSTARPYVP